MAANSRADRVRKGREGSEDGRDEGAREGDDEENEGHGGQVADDIIDIEGRGGS